MTEYRLRAAPRVDLDVEAVFQWYETEQSGLGAQFLAELDASYNRIVDGPLKYQDLGFGIRRALLRRFPYVVYFAVESDVIVVLTRSPRQSRPRGVAASAWLIAVPVRAWAPKVIAQIGAKP